LGISHQGTSWKIELGSASITPLLYFMLKSSLVNFPHQSPVPKNNGRQLSRLIVKKNYFMRKKEGFIQINMQELPTRDFARKQTWHTFQ